MEAEEKPCERKWQQFHERQKLHEVQSFPQGNSTIERLGTEAQHFTYVKASPGIISFFMIVQSKFHHGKGIRKCV